MTADKTSRQSHTIKQGIIATCFSNRTQIVHVPAYASKILRECNVNSPRRIAWEVTRIVDETIANSRNITYALLFPDDIGHIRIQIEYFIAGVTIFRRKHSVLSDQETEAEGTTGLAVFKPSFAAVIQFLVEQIKACRHVATEKTRFGEAEIDLRAFKTARQLQPKKLTAPHEVALRVADLAYDALKRGITASDSELTRLLFDDRETQVHAIAF